MIDGSNDGFWERDLVTGTVTYSARANQIAGLPAVDTVIAAEDWAGRVHPDDLRQIAIHHERLLAGVEERFDHAFRARIADGSWRWIRARGKVTGRDPSGGPTRLSGTITDIHDGMVAADALRRALFQLERHVTNTPLALVEWDGDHRVTRFSARAEEMFGWRAPEVVGKRIDEVPWVPEEDWPIVRAVMQAMATGVRPENVSLNRNLRKDGATIHCEWYNSSLHGPDGRLLSVFSLVQDVTARERAREALHGQRALSSRLAAMGRLVAGIAHAINNPLAAEISDEGLALEVVREVRSGLEGDAPLDRRAEARRLGDVVEALEEALESGRRIAQIVKDMTVFANPSPVRSRVRLGDVVQGALRWLPASIGRTSRIQVEDGGAPEVMASPGQLAQVVENLISNAVKAAPWGVRDTIVVRIGPGSDGGARLEVVDHGVGIAASEMDRIFDPFYTTRPAGEERGTGMGLAVCRSIVLAHDGTLAVESEAGKGSTFRVELPAAPAEG